MGRVLLLCVCAWAATGCGVKLAYNNIDRLAGWSADDYLKLDDAQEAFFKAELAAVLYWHRTTELPIYSRSLRQLDVALADGATIEEMFAFRQEAEGWWDRILEATLPLTSQLMYSATDAQLDRFTTEFAKDTQKYIKPYEKLSADVRRERWAKELRENVETFTGRLNNDQRQRARSVQRALGSGRSQLGRISGALRRGARGARARAQRIRGVFAGVSRNDIQPRAFLRR